MNAESNVRVEALSKWSRRSVAIFIGAFLFGAVVFVCAMKGVPKGWIDFHVLVGLFVGLGAIGLVGVTCAARAIVRRERALWVAYVGLLLNLALVGTGLCFTIL